MLYTPRAIAASSPPTSQHELALLGLDDRRAGVLAHRQHATGGDVGVLQQVEGDEPVVVACFRIVEDVAQLLQVRRAQEVGDVAHRRLGDERERLGLDAQEGAGGGLDGRHAVGGEQPVLGGVGPSGSSSVKSNSGMTSRYAVELGRRQGDVWLNAASTNACSAGVVAAWG